MGAQDSAALEPKITTFEEAEEIKPFGTPARIMLRTEETGGAFSALLVMHGPGEGPPPHSHAGQAEYFFVVEGTYEMTVAGETRIIGPGTMVFCPPNTVHTFKNIGDQHGQDARLEPARRPGPLLPGSRRDGPGRCRVRAGNDGAAGRGQPALRRDVREIRARSHRSGEARGACAD